MENDAASWKNYVDWGLIILTVVVAIGVARWQMRKSASEREAKKISQKIKSGNESTIYQAGGNISVGKEGKPED